MEPLIDVHGSDHPDWYENRIRLIKRQTNFWLNLPVIEKNMRVLELAKKMGFQLHGLTKGPRTTQSAWTEKLLWCQKHIDQSVDLTITMDKGLFYGRVLMDDYPEYMERWLSRRPRGIGIMPETKYNSTFKHPNVVHYDGSAASMAAVQARLQEAFDRPADCG